LRRAKTDRQIVRLKYKRTKQKNRQERPDIQTVETDRKKDRQTEQTDRQKEGPERLTEK